MLAVAEARVRDELHAAWAEIGAMTAQRVIAMPVFVNMPARMPPFSAEGMPNLRVSVPLSSDADPPQAWHVRADGGNVAGVSTSTLTGFDRIASRRVIITVVVLMAIVTGLSIWAQRSTGRETDEARAHVHALQVAES